MVHPGISCDIPQLPPIDEGRHRGYRPAAWADAADIFSCCGEGGRTLYRDHCDIDSQPFETQRPNSFALLWWPRNHALTLLLFLFRLS